jgi:hypothetical protein
MSSNSRHTGQNEVTGVVGFFDDAESLISAMRSLKQANYASIDAFTPYPVHGLEEAQGLARSPLPYVTFGAGLTGFCCAFMFEYWTSAVDWPLNVGGKPFNSWPAFVPIMFELTVLFAGLATVGAMFFLNGLPNTKRKAFDSSITRDRFALWIESPKGPVNDDPHMDRSDEVEAFEKKMAGFKKFELGEATEFMKKIGAKEVRATSAEGWF